MQLRGRIENIFLIFALFFGLIYALITPPFQSVDEGNHFLRSCAISKGQFISAKHEQSVGSILPKSLSELIQTYSSLEKNITSKTSFKEIKKSFSIKNNDKIFTTYPNTALYSPIPYIAQTTGIIAGRIFNAPPLLLLYIARIFNLILYCILGYYAIKSTPYLKLAIFLILLCPMNISLAASCSTDAALIGAGILFFAKILQYTFEKEKLSVKNYILLCALLIITALTKHNFYLFPLVFLIPKEKFGGKYLAKAGLIILIPLTLCLLWSYLISGLYVPLNPDADMYKQIDFIIHNPLKYIIILVISTIVKIFRLYITSIGVLGWQDTRLDNLTYIIYPILIWLSLIYSGAKNFILQKWQKYLIFLTVIFSYIIITTYLYLAWTKVGGNIIQGLNGKYYTLLLCPLFTLITAPPPKKLQHFKIYAQKLILISVFLILSSGAISLLIRFYDIFPYMNYQI